MRLLLDACNIVGDFYVLNKVVDVLLLLKFQIYSGGINNNKPVNLTQKVNVT
jgi:hypothetical protein